MHSSTKQQLLQRSPVSRRIIAPLIGLLGLALAASCNSSIDVMVVPITGTPDVAGGQESTATLLPTSELETPSETNPPDPPESLLAGANLLVPYLASGAADLDACLPRLVTAWGLAPTRETRCILANLNGDDASEFALLITLPSDEDTPPGDVWFFGSADEGYRLLGSARSFASAALEGVRIMTTGDLTGDTLPEIVIASLTCSSAICNEDILIISGHRGQLEDLAPDDINIRGIETAEIDDSTGDERLDLVLRGGALTSLGAGPPRNSEHTLSWSGLHFFVDEQREEATYLFHVIADADRLFSYGDYIAARKKYEHAATTTSLDDWKLESGEAPGRAELASYSLFRAGISALRLGDGGEGRVLLEQASRQHEGSLHAMVAKTYLAALIDGGTPGEACAAVEDLVADRIIEFEQVWDYGYANPTHTVAGLCR